ncbi:MAG: hypothetical protein ACE5HC_11500 [Candidatus Binatia bacterium]
MNRCLKDRALLLLYEGEGTNEQRAHLEACEVCSGRYRRLESDLRTIGQVLRQEPFPEALRYHPKPVTLKWLSTAAALGVVIALVWGGERMWFTSLPFPHATHNEEISQFLEEDFTAIFFPDSAIAEEAWPQGTDLRELSVALGEDWPCVDPPTWSETESSNEVDKEFERDTFPLRCSGRQIS